MTKIEFNDILSKHLMARWPAWKPGEAEQDDWWLMLRHATAGAAADAIRTHATSDACIQSRPKIALVRKMLPRPQRQVVPRDDRPRLELYMRSIVAPDDHPEWHDCQWITCLPCLSASREENLLEAAHSYGNELARSYAEANGGQWSAVVSEGSLEPEQLWGRAAREEAERRILSGPDAPGRRFLEGIRKGTKPDLLKSPEYGFQGYAVADQKTTRVAEQELKQWWGKIGW